MTKSILPLNKYFSQILLILSIIFTFNGQLYAIDTTIKAYVDITINQVFISETSTFDYESHNTSKFKEKTCV